MTVSNTASVVTAVAVTTVLTPIIFTTAIWRLGRWAWDAVTYDADDVDGLILRWEGNPNMIELVPQNTWVEA